MICLRKTVGCKLHVDLRRGGFASVCQLFIGKRTNRQCSGCVLVKDVLNSIVGVFYFRRHQKYYYRILLLK